MLVRTFTALMRDLIVCGLVVSAFGVPYSGTVAFDYDTVTVFEVFVPTISSEDCALDWYGNPGLR